MADTYRVLVEGKDDKHVFHQLLAYHQVAPLEIKDKDGIDNLLDTLDVELEASRLERLGVVVDADADLASRWQALRNILIRSGYSNVPDDPDPDGTIIQQEGRPTVGIWIMPDNKLAGILEGFVLSLIHSNDTLIHHAENCLQQIPERERRFPLERWDKAHIHTWLAWQEEPGKPLGQAIVARYLDAGAPEALRFVNWVRRLFDI